MMTQVHHFFYLVGEVFDRTIVINRVWGQMCIWTFLGKLDNPGDAVSIMTQVHHFFYLAGEVFDRTIVINRVWGQKAKKKGRR